MLAVLIQIEGDDLAIRGLNLLVFQINHHARIAAFFGIFHQKLQLVFGDNHRQDTVFKAVVVKDIRKAG